MADVLHITRCGRHALRSDESGPSGECVPCREAGDRMAALERVAAAARAGQVVIVDAFTMRMVAPPDWLPGLAAALAALDALKQGRTDD